VVELPESEKSIELGRIYAERDFLFVVSSDQRFDRVRTDDFANDLDSKMPHSQNDANSGHSSLLTKSCRSDDPQVRRLKFWCNDTCNDDYFPQGDEYENDFSRKGRRKREKKNSNDDTMNNDDYEKDERDDRDDRDHFQPTFLMLEDNGCISGDPLMRFIAHVDMTNQMRTDEGTMLMTKRISDKDAIEKLQTLIEKVTEFKRRVFRSEINTAKSNDGTDHAKSIGKDKSSGPTNRSTFQGLQEVLTSH